MATNKDLVDLLDFDLNSLQFSKLEKQEMGAVQGTMKLGLLH